MSSLLYVYGLHSRELYYEPNDASISHSHHFTLREKQTTKLKIRICFHSYFTFS